MAMLGYNRRLGINRKRTGIPIMISLFDARDVRSIRLTTPHPPDS